MAGFELYAPRLAKHRRTWTFFVILIGLACAILGPLIALIPFIVQTAVDTAHAVAAHPGVQPPKPAGPEMSTPLLIVAYVINVALIFLWVIVFERRSLATIGFNAKGPLRFIRGYVVGCGFLVAVIGLIYTLGGYKVENAGYWMAPTLASIIPILLYMAMFIIQGSSEEIWMRGWLMQIVASRHGIIWGLVINSLIFGALHLGNIKPSPELWGGAANVALFGVFISLYALKERSLWGVCGWHAAWNWLLGAGFGLEVSGMKLKVAPLVVDLMDTPNTPWWITGGSWGPEASVITTAVLLAGIVFLIWKGALKPGESYAVPAVAAPADATA